ncbi:MAG TPA: hypothetical protein VGR37_12010, partial [Longimicrobiaceae bacterium]|nr:hypothetical protein [Longimicrobiaceae bacterium]
VELGAWAEAARIAAARRDAEFFRPRESRAVLGRAGELPEPAGAALERIRRAVEGDGAPEWNSLERGISDLLQTVGG